MDLGDTQFPRATLHGLTTGKYVHIPEHVRSLFSVLLLPLFSEIQRNT